MEEQQQNENWVVYPRMIEDAPAITGVDLQFVGSAPDEERPQALRVVVGFLEVQENGLPDGDEYERLQPLEDALVEALGRAGAVFVGRRATEGQRQFFFYGPAGEAGHAAAAGVLEGVEDRECSVDVAEDPEWECYLEDLLPDDMEMRLIGDESVVRSLEEAGDPLTVPRPVTHFLYFKDAEARAAFAAASAAEGFKVELLEDEEDEEGEEEEEDGGGEDDGEDDEPFGLALERTDAVDLETINEITSDLALAAEEAGGRYDGWEAFYVGPDGKVAMLDDEDEDEEGEEDAGPGGRK